jgi:mono/diheme cytochrome c family protein
VIPRAIAVLVVALLGCESAPRFSAPMTLGGVEVSADVLNQGAHVYDMRCASCHAGNGSGEGNAGRALKSKPRDFRTADFRYKSTPDGTLPTDADIEAVIRQGRIEEGMPAWQMLSAEDVHAVIQYIKTFSPRWQPPAGAPG